MKFVSESLLTNIVKEYVEKFWKRTDNANKNILFSIFYWIEEPYLERIKELEKEVEELKTLHEGDQRALEAITMQWKAETSRLKSMVDELEGKIAEYECDYHHFILGKDGSTKVCTEISRTKTVRLVEKR